MRDIERGGRPPMDLGDPRTPMAWQHRDSNYRSSNGIENGYDDAAYNGRQQPQYTNGGGGGSSRYGGPPTPRSEHSRSARTPDHRRRDARGSSSERYSQHSAGGRKAPSRNSRSSHHHSSHHGYAGSTKSGGHSGHMMMNGYGASRSAATSHTGADSTTEETTAEETTETDSQAPGPERERGSDYSQHNMQMQMQHQQQMYPGYAVPVGFPIQQQIMGPIAPPQLIMAPNGSIRSVQSVPMLAAAAAAAAGAPTWDGEPCPVHHAHAHAHHHHQQSVMPLAALYGVHGHALANGHSMHAVAGPHSVPASVISGATTVRRARSVAEMSNGGFVPPGTPRLDHKSFHGSMHHMHAGGQHAGNPHAALMAVRSSTLPGRMVLGENGAASTLPIRDHKNSTPLPHKSDRFAGYGDSGLDCCSGHFVVVWIILGIITFGVLLGIILKFTIA